MAKFNLQKLLIEKGEKFALVAAAGGLAVLGVLGVIAATGADSPTTAINKIRNGATTLQGQINNESTTSKELPPEMIGKNTLAFNLVSPSEFRPISPMFEPVDQPNKARENPAVLGIVDAQLDLVRLPMKAYDLKISANGTVQIGVLKSHNIGKTDLKAIEDALKNNPKNRKPKSPPTVGGVPNPMGPMGPMGAGRGGAGGGNPYGATGGSGSGNPYGGDSGSGGSGSMYAPGAGAYDASGSRSEPTVDYVPIDQYDGKNPPAFIIFPRRTIVVHAAFPLKAQLEVIRRALRLKTVDEASRETTTSPSPSGPTFDGFEVERRVTTPAGQVFDYSTYDHVGQYVNTIYNRKTADQPDDGYIRYFLRYEQKMAIPLPAVAEGQAVYPEIRMDSIRATVDKLKLAQKPVITESDQQKKFKGDTSDPFMPQAGAAGGAGTGAFGDFTGADRAGPGVSMMGPMGANRGSGGRPGAGPLMPIAPGGPMGPMSSGGEGYGSGGPYGSGSSGALQNIQASVELEHMMIRFLDVDVEPGFTYQYRLRVKMKNPNFNRRDVGRPSDAKVAILNGPWTEIATKVTVSSDLNMYLADPVKYHDAIVAKYKDRAVQNLLDNKSGELPVVQIQTWMQQILLDGNKREPLGAWVLGEIPVNRGEFIGKKQLISLPLWSAEKVKFLLQTLPKYKVANAKEQPKGVLVDFTTSMMCVDFEGGKTKQTFGQRNVEDESAVEMLILRPDGSIFVRNSGQDADEADRVEREKGWNDWIKRVEDDTKNAGALTNPMGPMGDFGKGTK